MSARAGDAIDALIAQERLPPAYRESVERRLRPLAASIAAWKRAAARPIVVAVNGAQGSGKSTLCVFLECALLPELGLRAATLALDDFYLPKAERADLARRVHPLLATRGPPGTHDAGLMMRALDDLLAGRSARVPAFDKARDDRSEAARVIAGPIDVVLFEGWCVGATAQAEDDLRAPANALERDEDGDGVWRRHVNDALDGDYADVFARIDRLVMLKAPDMETVLANRLRQEAKLRAARPGASDIMDDAGVARFIQHYERLTRWQLATLPARADAVIDVAALQR